MFYSSLCHSNLFMEDSSAAANNFVETSVPVLPNLQYLHLHDFFTDEVAGWVAASLAGNSRSSLLELGLLNSPMGDAGARALTEQGQCSRNLSLRMLFIIPTNVSDAGCQALAALGTKDGLRCLVLHGGAVTDVGVKALETALRHSIYSLEELELGGSIQVTQSVKSNISRLIKQKRRLRAEFELLEKGHDQLPDDLWQRAFDLRRS